MAGEIEKEQVPRFGFSGDVVELVLDIGISLARAKARILASLIPQRLDLARRCYWSDVAGILLNEMYLRTGAIQDLDMAIRYARSAMPDRVLPPSQRASSATTFPQNGQYRDENAENQNNLACYLGHRYLRLGARDDIDEAISLAHQAVKNTPQDSEFLAGRMNNLATLLGDRYSAMGNAEDSDHAVRWARESVEASSSNDGDALPVRLNNLSALLGEERRGNSHRVLSRTDEAISCLVRALETAPESNCHTGTLLYNLARLHQVKFRDFHDEKNLERARQCFFAALTQKWAFMNTRILAGRVFLSLPGIIHEADRAMVAVRTCARLVSASMKYSLKTKDKQRVLSQALGIGSDSAAVALHVGMGAFYAMALLETGRAVLSNSLLNLRIDISSLSESDPQLTKDFSRTRGLLDGSRDPLGSSRILENLQYPVDSQLSRRAYERTLISSIEELRGHPMFHRILGHPTEAEMLDVAKHGPVVAVNATAHRCDALIIQPDGISSLELPSLTLHSIRAHRRDTQSVETLGWLWETIVSPVLDRLGYDAPPAGGQALPHTWWIPTGPLVGFPLHAAGYHLRRNSETAMDRVISSYTLSVNALIRIRQQRQHHGSAVGKPEKAIIVSAPSPPGHQFLRHARDETVAVGQACESIGVSQVQSAFNPFDTLDALKSCSIFHFAGHGRTDKQDPLGGSLIFDDGDELSVDQLLETTLNSNPPFLAYLSACGTGRIENEGATDEIHLASAFQLSGFRHIIATLWEVDDELCVTMAKRFYEALGREPLTDVSVRVALHEAVKALRDQWVQAEVDAGGGQIRGDRNPMLVQESSRSKALWVPYVHFGA
ncbi:CHAT domain-containing protein [Dichotomopilus funicola]|uniref:CHAT domain-containing protein n=1 Tax=Dichotomopilus funicola TaxID=1934379 RepID=A0AAN6V0C6_9PEZI|nr:CHAT domain-containing protein [Dichotomopilus funicola]